MRYSRGNECLAAFKSMGGLASGWFHEYATPNVEEANREKFKVFCDVAGGNIQSGSLPLRQTTPSLSKKK